MGRLVRSPLAAAALATAPVALAAQDGSEVEPAPGHWSLDLPARGCGISFGNSPRFTGVRFNLEDAGLERINGINVTFRRAGKPVTGAVTGLATLAQGGVQTGVLNIARSNPPPFRVLPLVNAHFN